MRKCAVWAVALALGLCATAAVALTNGDFEAGTTGWNNLIDNNSGLTGGTFTTRNTVTAYAGESLGIGREGTSYDGPQASWFNQNIAVTPGAQYTVTVSGKFLAYLTDAYIDGNWWGIGARVALFDGAGTTDPNVNPDDWGALGNKIGGATQWLQHSEGTGVWFVNDDGELEEETVDVADNGIWRDFSFTKTFSASDSFVELRLGIHDKVSLDWGPGEDPPFPPGVELVAFDNVDVQLTRVPEPGSIACLLSGFVGLIGYGIRRRR
jgi:hypothetical protein